MAGKKKTNEEEVVKEKDVDWGKLASSVGANLLDDIEPVKFFIDTGNLAMNFICSGKFITGGIPGNRITEISGPSSSGKSLWATNLLRGAQAINGIPVYLDCENALDREFAVNASHVDPQKIVHCCPEYMEAAFLKIYNVMSKVREKYDLSKPLVFVYDSLASSPCERELRETKLSENYTDAEWKRIVGTKEQPGERARICSREFRKLNPILEKFNATLLVIDQIRNKIGGYGDPTTTTGGLALQFYGSCRIRTQPSKKIENNKGSVIGVRLRAKNIKNKCSLPFKEAEGINLYFEKGINPISGLLDVLLVEGRIDGDKGNYSVNEKYSNGKVVKFKASKEKNLVPVDVLLDCPALIDATSREQVEDYLTIFADAINQTFSGGDIEKEVKNDLLDDDSDLVNSFEE